MRTNIDIDESLIQEAMKLSGVITKKVAVEEAPRQMVSLKKQERIKELRGKFKWEGNLDEMPMRNCFSPREMIIWGIPSDH
jgi:Arc/MetJ family transcription regulator